MCNRRDWVQQKIIEKVVFPLCAYICGSIMVHSVSMDTNKLIRKKERKGREANKLSLDYYIYKTYNTLMNIDHLFNQVQARRCNVIRFTIIY